MLANAADALTIELSNAEIEIVFTTATRIAVAGAPAEYSNSAFDIDPAVAVRIAAPRSGLRVYVAVLGGWIPDGIETVLARAGRRLSAGDVFEHKEREGPGRNERLASEPGSLKRGTIRVLPGPQPLVEVGGQFSVSNQSDRTGIRLDGLSPMGLPELPSEPACVGAIQVTPSGQLVVIGPDGPTIGGYPKVAVVCSADLDRLAHLRPGQAVDLEVIGIETATTLMAERESRIRRTVSLLSFPRS
jgi:allophanate hydrolase subunit 2